MARTDLTGGEAGIRTRFRQFSKWLMAHDLWRQDVLHQHLAGFNRSTGIPGNPLESTTFVETF